MVDTYHELANVADITDQSDLVIPRARALVDAIVQHRDYSLVRLGEVVDSGQRSDEIIVVDVECDGVPSKNPFGIAYRERLALCVPKSPATLVEVLALRQDFPVLIHQNHGARFGPASLCLYFEPASAVLRTWTPQRFLRRIQWWLEQSAKGELHPADQPVEHLFFATKCELVLPWNIDQLRDSKDHRLVVYRGAERPDKGLTCFVEAIPKAEAPKAPKGTIAAHIELTLPPIVHGFVERNPTTLGELADMLTQRGVDLLPPLKDALRNGIGDAGVPVTAPETFVVFILHIPMARHTRAEPDRVTHRAFLADVDARQLGVAAGALFVHAERYYRDQDGAVFGAPVPTSWRAQTIAPMEVLQRNSIEAARQQSGIKDEGPVGTLVGVGSLGSALLNLWGRAGWGRWTVVDKDHIKPHNLARHVAFSPHVGWLKTDVVSDLHAALTNGASIVIPVYGDGCDQENATIKCALNTSQVVVDATTTLEYPRLVSTIDGLGRHVSVFLTPSGNSSVLMVEDHSRALRLRSLEAQYYRALICEIWGEHHLDGNLSTFWSGASCRDISVVMPYSRIMAHASTLSEQVMAALSGSEAAIRVWHRDPSSGAVSVHVVDTFPELRLSLGEMSLFFDTGLEAHLRALRASHLPNETGGILLGYYDFNVKAIVVVDALPAPEDSKSTPASFERGVAGLAEAVNEASRRTAGIVGYLGEWHSHPPGHSAAPSRNDLVQLIHVALGMQEDGLPGVQLIVGEGDIQVLQGTVGA